MTESLSSHPGRPDRGVSRKKLVVSSGYSSSFLSGVGADFAVPQRPVAPAALHVARSGFSCPGSSPRLSSALLIATDESRVTDIALAVGFEKAEDPVGGEHLPTEIPLLSPRWNCRPVHPTGPYPGRCSSTPCPTTGVPCGLLSTTPPPLPPLSHRLTWTCPSRLPLSCPSTPLPFSTSSSSRELLVHVRGSS